MKRALCFVCLLVASLAWISPGMAAGPLASSGARRVEKPRHLLLGFTLLKEHGFGALLRGRYGIIAADVSVASLRPQTLVFAPAAA